SGDVNYIAGRDRFEGYQQGLKKFGLPYSNIYIQYASYQIDSGYACMLKLLALPERPSAVICTADIMAIGAMTAVQDAGLHVPGDISIVGFDNTKYAEIVKPGLTTVNQNIESMGARAVEHLLSMIGDPNLSPPVLTEPVDLVVRHSTGPAK